jgi:peroxiredoxin
MHRSLHHSLHRSLTPLAVLGLLAAAPSALRAQARDSVLTVRPPVRDSVTTLGAGVIGGPEEGRRAPDFTLAWANRDTTSEGGEPFVLRHDMGKVVVLVFFPQDLTPSATAMLRTMTERYDELFGPGVTVVGISPDPVATHRAFARSLDLPFRLLSDPQGRIARKYGTPGLRRAVYVLGPDSRVRYRDLEFGPRDARAFEALKRAVREAGKQVASRN